MRRLILVAASAVALGIGGAGVGYALEYNPGSSSLDWKADDLMRQRAGGSETTDWRVGYGIPASPSDLARIQRQLAGIQRQPQELHSQAVPTVYPNQDISGGPV